MSRDNAALALLVAVLLVFWDAALLWPFRVLIVLFHEAGHAMMALCTGGTVLSITLSPAEGGATLTQGGSIFLILNAGYLGSLAAGLALLRLTRKDAGQRGLSVVLGGGLLGAAFTWLDGFAFFYGLAAALGFGLLGLKASHRTVRWVLRAIGTLSVLYALFDIRDDVLFGAGRSDAVMLAERTGIPALIWGVGWLAISAVVVWGSRRWWATGVSPKSQGSAPNGSA